ncbi:MAG: 16S rRNA (guanine(966)-N(2))-methyltransferase RsmD [Sumerlaeia bacterium]
MLRIIAGERRGTKLQTLEGSATRPLRDRVRESLFNILQGDVPGANVMDLFAGSGAVGLEALSRGARHAAFVEGGADARRVVSANIAKMRYDGQSQVVGGMLPGALSGVKAEAGGFGLIFLMPPYHSGAGQQTLAALPASGLLAPDPLAVLELHKDEALDLPDSWEIERDKAYGITRLLFLRRAVAG